MLVGMRRPQPLPVGPGQESVWDYPRPPALEPVEARIRVELAGAVVADTTRAWRVLETSHPPNYYLHPDDVDRGCLERAPGGSFCEWKGTAAYWTVRVGDRVEVAAAWSYPSPTASYTAIRDHLAFYAGRMDACWVGDERATPQPGGFYGGWITSGVVGPFKGVEGSRSW
jgi:uncharacterized protein (DUF427 family)